MSQSLANSLLEKSSPAIHPLDILDRRKPHWMVSRQSVDTDSLIVQHSIQPPDNLEVPLSTHHVLVFQLSSQTPRITQIGRERYEGSINVAEFFLQPAPYSSYYSWETTDENIVIIIKPEYLTEIAVKVESLNPDCIELSPVVVGRDPTIEHIARAFLAEMQNKALGGKLYTETLATQLAIHLLRNYCTFPVKLKQYKKGLSQSQLQVVFQYIDANLEYSISLEQLASLCQLSSHYFCQLFRQSTGISVLVAV